MFVREISAANIVICSVCHSFNFGTLARCVLQETLAACPTGCYCEVADQTIKFNVEEMSEYKVNVVCSDLALSSLPPSLPPHTIYLQLENNKVRRCQHSAACQQCVETKNKQ